MSIGITVRLAQGPLPLCAAPQRITPAVLSAVKVDIRSLQFGGNWKHNYFIYYQVFFNFVCVADNILSFLLL